MTMKVLLIVLSAGLLAEMVSAFTCLSCVRHTYDKEDDVLKNIIQGALNTSDGFSSACGDKDPEVASAECEGNKDTCSTYHLDVGLTVTIADQDTEYSISSIIRGCSDKEAACTDEVDDAKQILQTMADKLKDVVKQMPGDAEVDVKVDSAAGVACFCEEDKCNKQKSSEMKASSAAIHQTTLAALLPLVAIFSY